MWTISLTATRRELFLIASITGCADGCFRSKEDSLESIFLHRPLTPHPLSLLDIGCGTGYFARYMQEHGYHITAIEQDSDARAFVQKHHGFTPHSSLLGAPLQEHQFDVITLWHVLEHIDTLEEHFDIIRHSIAKEGLLVVALPNPCSWDAGYYKTAWAAWDVPRHPVAFLARQYSAIGISIRLSFEKGQADVFRCLLYSVAHRTSKRKDAYCFCS